jgi:hypothetical protein
MPPSVSVVLAVMVGQNDPGGRPERDRFPGAEGGLRSGTIWAVRHRMEGIIAAAGFASGDRVVVGHWASTPIGPMSDVMWAAPDGIRTLFAPTDAVATFVTAVYDFDQVVVGPLVVEGDARGLDVRIGPHVIAPVGGPGGEAATRTVCLRSGPGWRIPPRRRPPALTRLVEAPIARVAMGVRTYGVSPRGVREWYQATEWRPLVSASATIDDESLGPMRPIDPPCGFGFSEPPRRPSLTVVRPLLEDPSGHLDTVLAELAELAPRGPDRAGGSGQDQS